MPLPLHAGGAVIFALAGGPGLPIGTGMEVLALVTMLAGAAVLGPTLWRGARAELQRHGEAAVVAVAAVACAAAGRLHHLVVAPGGAGLAGLLAVPLLVVGAAALATPLPQRRRGSLPALAFVGVDPGGSRGAGGRRSEEPPSSLAGFARRAVALALVLLALGIVTADPDDHRALGIAACLAAVEATRRALIPVEPDAG